MKKLFCLISAAALLFLCGCQSIAEYSSGSVDVSKPYYTTSIVGTFESEESGSSDTYSKVSSNTLSSAVSASSKPEKVSSDTPSAQSSSSKSVKPSSSENQSSQATSSSTVSLPNKPTYHYYENLNESQKKLYDIVNTAVYNMETDNIVLGKCSLSDAMLAYTAVRTDHPEYFWLPTKYIKGITPDGKIFLDLDDKPSGISYTCTKEERVIMESKISNKINEIRKMIPSGIDDYKAELIIHDWLCQNVYYADNSDDSQIYTSYGAIVNGTAVCEGYARAMQLLCNEFSIPCTLVCGEAKNQDGKAVPHMWNLIKIRENWYHLDVTWNDDNTYQTVLHNYFNLNDDYIKLTHKVDQDFSTLSEKDFEENLIKGFNFRLPSCKTLEWHYSSPNWKNCQISEKNIDISISTIRNKLSNAKKNKEKYCEFFILEKLDSSITEKNIFTKYSLQSCINDVNLVSVRYALSGQTFIVFLEYEGE